MGQIYPIKVDCWIGLILMFTAGVLIGCAVPFVIGPPAKSPLGLVIGVFGLALAVLTGWIRGGNRQHLAASWSGLRWRPIPGRFRDNDWNCVEAYFKLNPLDVENDRPNRDGIVRAWFDGKMVVGHTDVVLRSTEFPTMKFNQFLMAPYFGSRLLPHAQKLWIDELAVGTKRIGSLELEK